MIKVGVLGSTGMLGATLSEALRQEGFLVQEFNRRGRSRWPKQSARMFEVDDKTSLGDLDVLSDCDVVVNALGLIKQVMNEEDADCQLQAHLVNSFFPLLLNEFTEKFEIPVIQIGTDCVFSGAEGNYSESSAQSYTDLYSFTKSVGEQLSPGTCLLRTSVIGCEREGRFSLLSWVLGQERNAQVLGFKDHLWNGLTSLHFAKITIGVIRSQNYSSGVRHVLPLNIVTKETLVKTIAENFGRNDIEVLSHYSGKPIDRSLSTKDFEANLRLWVDAGYDKPLTIQEMVSEYALWENKDTFN